MTIDSLLGFFDNFSASILFLLVLFVEAGIPIPIPYDILILAAGARQASFPHILLAVILGNLVGSTILYSISLKFGHPVLLKSSKLLGVNQKRLNLIAEWFRQWGGFAIVFARLIPGFRFAATVFSGAFSLPYFKVFLPYLALGSILWVSLYWLSGALFAESISLLVQVLGIWSTFWTLVLIFLLALLFLAIFKKRYDGRSANH